MPISSRPPEVGAWMKHARPWSEMPINDEFLDQCKAWWQEVQPVDRAPFDRREDIVDWGRLNTAGPCGVMIIVIVLDWWRYAKGANEDWEELVEDVGWVLEHMRGCEPIAGKASRASGQR